MVIIFNMVTAFDVDYSGNGQLLLPLVWKPKRHSRLKAAIDRTRLNTGNGILSSIGDFFFVFSPIIPRIPLTTFSRVLPRWPCGATRHTAYVSWLDEYNIM